MHNRQEKQIIIFLSKPYIYYYLLPLVATQNKRNRLKRTLDTVKKSRHFSVKEFNKSNFSTLHLEMPNIDHGTTRTPKIIKFQHTIEFNTVNEHPELLNRNLIL